MWILSYHYRIGNGLLSISSNSTTLISIFISISSLYSTFCSLLSIYSIFYSQYRYRCTRLHLPHTMFYSRLLRLDDPCSSRIRLILAVQTRLHINHTARNVMRTQNSKVAFRLLYIHAYIQLCTFLI